MKKEKKKLFDLHIHSFHSDGELSLEKIIKIAKSKGVPGFSITDHNFLKHSPSELLDLSRRTGLFIIPGIEISTFFRNLSLHILGYGKIIPEAINPFLISVLQGYENRAKKIIAKLKRAKINVTYEKLKKKYSAAAYLSKNAIAHEVAGLVSFESARQVLKTKNPYKDLFWVKEKDHFVPASKKAIKIIKQAGGVAVWAHPGELLANNKDDPLFDKSYKNLVKIVSQLKEWGLEGIEAKYWYHSPFKQKIFKKLASSFNLFITGGTDWHGFNWTPEIKFGGAGLNKREFKVFIKRIGFSRLF